MIKVLSVFGTRPEAIKFAPVVKALEADEGFISVVCTTSQHRQMLSQVLDVFGMSPDIDLDIMSSKQGLIDIATRVLSGLGEVIADLRPDWLLVQGDTTTSFAAALCAYYSRVNLGHIEAGLRSGSKLAPYPEELNRRGTAVFADAHFAPTAGARENLLRENVPEDRIWVTGNTSIDALHMALSRLENHPSMLKSMEARFPFLDRDKRLVLVTAHRRESFGEPFEQICVALREIAKAREDVQLVYPVHLNPNVREPVERIIGRVAPQRHGGAASFGPPLANVFLIEPLDYLSFVYLMNRAFLIVTDSGGIQEEAPTLGKPVLVMREVTERPEAVEAGGVKLMGTSSDRIVSNTLRLLDEAPEYRRMAVPRNVYGDGKAGQRIVAALHRVPSPSPSRY